MRSDQGVIVICQFKKAYLVNPNPVWEETDFNVNNKLVCLDFIVATIGPQLQINSPSPSTLRKCSVICLHVALLLRLHFDDRDSSDCFGIVIGFPRVH